jgi:hypothetical protein
MNEQGRGCLPLACAVVLAVFLLLAHFTQFGSVAIALRILVGAAAGALGTTVCLFFGRAHREKAKLGPLPWFAYCFDRSTLTGKYRSSRHRPDESGPAA